MTKPTLDYLFAMAELLPRRLEMLCHVPLHNLRFQTWPASVDKHHPYEGGLIEHTAEILTVLDVVTVQSKHTEPLNPNVLITAAIWHDYGKIFDYERNPLYIETDKEHRDRHGGVPYAPERPATKWPWGKTPHYSQIRHVSRSYLEFNTALDRLLRHGEIEFEPAERAEIEAINHCILAHHGRLDWGSPVEPQTPEAWALHLADMMSVRAIAKVKSPKS